jgi:hypothetical protein
MSAAQRKATARFRGAKSATPRLLNRRLLAVEQGHVDVAVAVNPLAAPEENTPRLPQSRMHLINDPPVFSLLPCAAGCDNLVPQIGGKLALSRSLATAGAFSNAPGLGRHYGRTWLSQSFWRFASPCTDGCRSRIARMARLCFRLRRIFRRTADPGGILHSCCRFLRFHRSGCGHLEGTFAQWTDGNS